MDGVGPLQLIFIDFESAVLPPLVHAQIDDLRRRGLVRLIDSLVAIKESEGRLIVMDTLDAPRADPVWSGVLAQALLGSNINARSNVELFTGSDPLLRPASELGVTEEQLLEIADLVPTTSRVLILLIEHLWTADLDMAALEARGHMIANCWISPALLGQMLQRESPLFR